MRFFGFLLLFIVQFINSQGQIGPNFVSLTRGVDIVNQGKLDGINLGIVSVEMNMTAGNPGNPAEIEMYLVAPDGHSIFLFKQSFLVKKANFVFTNEPSQPSFRNWNFNSVIQNPYQPFGNFNALNDGKSANGNWRLYARQTRSGVYANVNEWKINLGTTNIEAGAINQNIKKSISLINTSQTKNFVKGNNRFYGTNIFNSKGSEAGDPDYLETNIWYYFTPKCKNDRIEITSNLTPTQSGLLTFNRDIIQTKEINQSTYSYNIENYIPGEKYLIVLDGIDANTFDYQIKWFEGDIDCIKLPEIVTLNQFQPAYCKNSKIEVNFSVTGTINKGNSFIAQVSDTNGNFNNPQNMGSIHSRNEAFIPATLPSNLLPGKNYKVRVISTSPECIGTSNYGFDVITIPKIPLSIVGADTVCAGEKDIRYTSPNHQEKVTYDWKINNPDKIETSRIDGIDLLIDFKDKNCQLSLSMKNVCGNSAVQTKYINVNSLIKPVVTISQLNDKNCLGDTLKFGSTIVGCGQNPKYQWLINNIDYGLNFEQLSLIDLSNNDAISLRVKANLKCSQNRNIESNSLEIKIQDTISPKIFLKDNLNLCFGSVLSVKADIQNAGDRAVIQWYLNNQVQNVSDSIFNSNKIKNGDSLYVMIESTTGCSKNPISTSKKVGILVSKSVIEPVVEIMFSKNEVCLDEKVIFNIKHEGSSEKKFLWLKNGKPEGIKDSFETTLGPKPLIILNYRDDLSCGQYSKTFIAPLPKIKDPAPILTIFFAPEKYCIQDSSVSFHTDNLVGVNYNWTTTMDLNTKVEGPMLNVKLYGKAIKGIIKVKASNECGESNELEYSFNPSDCSPLFIPNAIRTSDENGNNLWLIKGIEDFPNCKILVFNRWGNKIYSSIGYNKSWDGKENGKLLPAATYYYIIEGILDHPITGDLTILN